MAAAPLKKPKQPSAKIGWVFTAKAQCQDQEELLQLEEEAEYLFGALIDHVNILAFQLEVGKENGYLHYQGYFELINKKRLTWIKSNIYPFEYLDGRRGTPLQAWTYATKDETRVLGPWTIGDCPVENDSGAQKSLEKFGNDIIAGFSDTELFRAHPSCYIRYPRVIDRLRQFSPPTRAADKNLEVYLFYGPPGTGKTEFAKHQAHMMGYYPCEIPIGKDFWLTPHFFGQQYVIIDEFKANISLKDLLRLLDKYPIQAPVKGDFLWWCPHIIVITTNVSPWSWYKYNDRDYEREALFRRITVTYKFAKSPDAMPHPVQIDLNDSSNFPPVQNEVVHPLMNDYNLFMRSMHSTFMNNKK